ncbi:hypothetical protein VSR01_17300 [Actinacidiphila sp. DG2A-62]|uniref:hypothetical protein n=1 Tax=Actinacidiphila sp. DG2A-62 TaxID=3108821 RepID=UPI002DBC553E|nr:hypothetical protein [Actinacidiphila sp. DG2A-62]MEC3995195.1 hypothetical protein [Actinacidiphila sp. DG2A-62]
MYEVTIEHPAFEEKTFTAKDGGELRTLIYGVARAQGKQVDNDSDMIAEVGAVRSRADVEGVGVIEVYDLTVKVAPAENPSDYACEGHESLYVGLGESAYCDGGCVRRLRFTRDSLVELTLALDDEELDETGGCGRCGLEADQMCVGCGRCNCDTHGSCERPDGEPDTSGQ